MTVAACETGKEIHFWKTQIKYKSKAGVQSRKWDKKELKVQFLFKVFKDSSPLAFAATEVLKFFLNPFGYQPYWPAMSTFPELYSKISRLLESNFWSSSTSVGGGGAFWPPKGCLHWPCIWAPTPGVGWTNCPKPWWDIMPCMWDTPPCCEDTETEEAR